MAGRILAVDYGRRRVGLAVSDPLGIIPRGLPTLERGKDEIGTLRRIVAEEEVAEIVVGLPLVNDGSEGPAALEARAYGERLAKELGRPVAFHDESLTTARAETLLLEGDFSRRRRKGLRDRIAAQIILESFLAERRVKKTGAAPPQPDAKVSGAEPSEAAPHREGGLRSPLDHPEPRNLPGRTPKKR